MRSREELEDLLVELMKRVGELDETLTQMDLPKDVKSKLLAVRDAMEAILED